MKKSQIQLSESTTIIIIVIIMLVIGFVFYAYLKADNIKKDQELIEEYNAIQLSLIASNVPELYCNGDDVNCYDLLKIRVLQELIESSRREDDKTAWFYYSDMFGNSEIDINIVYPDQEEEIHLYRSVEEATESYSVMRIPTVVHDPIEGTNNLGIITIKKYY